jgi:hypothetical protein
MMEQHGKPAGNENIHTLLIGTSKTQPGEKYFYSGANIGKFWGTLSNVSDDFKGSEETSKLKSKGIIFQDISSAEGGQEKKDKEIKAINLQNGFVKLEKQIIENPKIQRIAFIGKQAAQWFFIRFLDKINLIENDLIFKVDLFEYGKQEWKVNFGNKQIECYVLRNTGRQWEKDPEDWITFWNDVFE